MNRTIGSLVAALVVATLVSAGTAVYALAGHQPASVQSITGCITSTGKLVKVKLGDIPKGGSCGAQTQVHLSGGDITAVLPGYGLSPRSGATEGAATLDADPTVLQNRVLKVCGTDAAISQIHEDGSVDCDKDDGFRNYVLVEATAPFSDADFKRIEVDCPAGTRLVGGGGNVLSVQTGTAFLEASGPDTGETGEQWEVDAHESGLRDTNWGLTAYAFCADFD